MSAWCAVGTDERITDDMDPEVQQVLEDMALKAGYSGLRDAIDKNGWWVASSGEIAVFLAREERRNGT